MRPRQTLASLILLCPSAFAQVTQTPPTPPIAVDVQAAQRLGSVLVTGTRAKDRTLLNSAVPVDVLSQEDLRRAVAGDGNLAAALQSLLPSFNFPRQSNSGGGDHVRAAQLRGMSPDQVLVLVNGKRRHNSAIVNLESKTGKGTNPVDFNAIPVSAIKRIEVLRDGAGAQYGSDAIGGVINIILDDARSGGAVEGTLGAFRTRFAPTDQRITDGQSRELSAKLGGALGERGFLSAGAELAHRNHTNRAGADQLPFFEDQTPANLATIGQRNYAPGEPASDQGQLWFNAGMPLSGVGEAYAFGTWQQRKSIGAAYYRYPDSTANLQSVYPNGYRPETTGNNRDAQLAAGLRGQMATWDFDLSLTLGRNDFDYGVQRSLNASLGAASPTAFHLGDFAVQQTSLNADFTREVSLPGLTRPATLALGGEARRDAFRTRPGDAASYAVGPFDGPSGAQAGPGLQAADAVSLGRTVLGVYADLSAELSPQLYAQAAVRADHSSDFGNASTAKLSARYAFTPTLAVRGALSSNFRAPSLAQSGFSFTVTDRGDGGALTQIRTLPVSNPAAQALGAQPLKAEKARNASLGLTAQPTRQLSLSVDAYDIRVRDRITLSERISNINFFSNALDTRTRGVDLVASWQTRALAGDVQLGYVASFNRTTLSDANNGLSPVGLEERNTLTDAAPRQRHVFTGQWSDTRWHLLARATRQGSATRVFDFGDGFTPTQTYAARWQLDLEAEIKLSRQFSMSVGGVNVTDRYPSRSIDDISYFGNFPYDVLSPVGFNGAYFYLKGKYSF